jgi:hypothetical protein
MTLPTLAQLNAVTSVGADGTYEPQLRTVLDALVAEHQVTDTATNFNSQAASINTTGKYAGRRVWSSTASKPVYAAGALASSVWVDSAGTTVYTPV